MRVLFAITTLLILLACSCGPGQSADEQESGSSNDENSTEESVASDSENGQEESTDDINASDFDLLVKRIEDPNRGSWQNPELVIDKLGDLTGKTLADIGAGTGYFTFRLAPLVDKVISIDIEERSLQFIEDKKAELSAEQYEKIETRLSQVDDPLLVSGEVDRVLIVNTYHFINNRTSYLRKVVRGLASGGMLVLVDFKSGDVPVVAPEELRVPVSTAVEEIENAGFSNIVVDSSSLQYQYIITAQN